MRQRGLLFWLVLGGIFIVLFNAPTPVSRSLKNATREALSPVQQLTSNYRRRFLDTMRSIRGWGSLFQENQRISEKLVELKGQMQELEALERENVALRKQLKFAQRADRHLIPAEVVSRDVSGWWQTIRLNKGATDGVSINRAVVTEEGLVGRVVDVSVRTCDVLLISDPSCKVSCTMPRPSGFGVLSGRGLSWNGSVICNLNLINKRHAIDVRDEVVTSGLGGVFPKGILVGYIDQVFMDDSGLYQKAELLPAENLGSLEFVFIVADEDPLDALLKSRSVAGEADTE